MCTEYFPTDDAYRYLSSYNVKQTKQASMLRAEMIYFRGHAV